MATSSFTQAAPPLLTHRPTIREFPISAWPEIAPRWRATAPSSIYLTAEWTECWLEAFGSEVHPMILMLADGNDAVGFCMVVRNRGKLVNRIWLNASGESSRDTTYIEYNGVVAKAGWERVVTETVAEYLAKAEWDELYLSGFPENATYEILKAGVGATRCTELRHPVHYVNLASIRESGLSYVDSLTGKSGKRLRENLRYYGPLNATVASDADSALEMLSELGELSRKRWAKVGRRSIFCSPKFVQFHHLFIRKCFDLGWIQMIRVTQEQQVVGIVYNIVYGRKVLFYQCGYFYPADKRLSPGRATLTLAIQHCLDAGYEDFDFLSGEVKYKEWMSTGSRTMLWATIQRDGFKMKVLDALRRIKKGSFSEARASEGKAS